MFPWWFVLILSSVYAVVLPLHKEIILEEMCLINDNRTYVWPDKFLVESMDVCSLR